MAINPQVAARLFKIKRHQLEMVRDRGYDISSEAALFEYTLDDFIRVYSNILQERNAAIHETIKQSRTSRRSAKNELTFREVLDNLYQKEDGTLLLVHYAESPAKTGKVSRLGVEPIGEFIKMATDNGVQWAILISEQDISSEAAKNLQKISAIHFQHFFDEELMYNPTKHYLVPKHEVLSPEETSDFLKRNNLKLSQLPIIKFIDPIGKPLEKDKEKKIDPIVKYYGFLPGQIVRIYRENFITETLVDSYITYRLVFY